MSGGINLGDLPSWMLVLLLGLGIEFSASNGILTQYASLGRFLIFAGICLGAFYFSVDISNKV